MEIINKITTDTNLIFMSIFFVMLGFIGIIFTSIGTYLVFFNNSAEIQQLTEHMSPENKPTVFKPVGMIFLILGLIMLGVCGGIGYFLIPELF